MTKMTYAIALDNAIKAVSDPETIEKLEALKAQLAKRSASKSGKPSKAQLANAELGERIVTEMPEGGKLSISDMIKALDCVAGLSTQKVSPICAKLVEAGKLSVEVVKGKKLYSLAG